MSLAEAEERLNAAREKYLKILEEVAALKHDVAEFTAWAELRNAANISIGYFSILPIEITEQIVCLCKFNIAATCKLFYELHCAYHKLLLTNSDLIPKRIKYWMMDAVAPIYLMTKCYLNTVEIHICDVWRYTKEAGGHILIIKRRQRHGYFVAHKLQYHYHRYYNLESHVVTQIKYGMCTDFKDEDNISFINAIVDDLTGLTYTGSKITGHLHNGTMYTTHYIIVPGKSYGVGLTNTNIKNGSIDTKLILTRFNRLAVKCLIKHYIRDKLSCLKLNLDNDNTWKQLFPTMNKFRSTPEGAKKYAELTGQ